MFSGCVSRKLVANVLAVSDLQDDDMSMMSLLKKI